MTDELLKSVDALLQRSVPLVIIGGHAVISHGHVRATQDVDIIYQRTSHSEHQLYEALADINAFWITDTIDPATGIEKTQPVDLSYVQNQRLMMLGTDFGFLDVFDFVPGLPDDSAAQVIQDAIVINNRPFASLNWLRRMKLASGRPIDLSDLESLPE